MKTLFFKLAPAVLVFACAAPEYLSYDYARIDSESEFNRLVVGKTLAAIKLSTSAGDGAWFVLEPDGRVTGYYPGVDTVSGTWEWKNGEYCSEVTLGSDTLPYGCKPAWFFGNTFRLPARLDPNEFAYYQIE